MAYARQAKNYEMEIMAAEIRVRAERRAGDLLEKMEKQGPGQYQQWSSDATVDIPPTLAELGITKDQSSSMNFGCWQKTSESGGEDRSNFGTWFRG